MFALRDTQELSQKRKGTTRANGGKVKGNLLLVALTCSGKR